jgi:beta-mannosidase
MRQIFFCLILTSLLGALFGCKTQANSEMIELNHNWTFRQANKGTWMPATVPGTVHTDLMSNGKIPDPYFRMQEEEVQWVDKADWEYTCRFNLSADFLEYEAITLQCLGLDTHADVYVNDHLAILADNFFVGWEKEVKRWLKPGENQLRIYFHSPIKVGLQALAKHQYGLPATNDQSERGGLGDKKVSAFLRKPGYHFGWDWGPRLVSSGIYRPIRLMGWNKARLSDVYFHQDSITEYKAYLTARCEVFSRVEHEGLLEIFQGDTLLGSQEIAMLEGHNEFHVPLEIYDPQLWWTHDLGKPQLYNLKARLSFQRKPINEISHKIGLRTIKVVQEKDGKGSSFYFELNGRPIFAKGANYIPNDVFIPRVGPEKYQNLIRSTVEANMNMLRIWGGGFYENDIFYDLCNEAGVLVWQDFMFACSMYPGDPEFQRNVEEEAVYNVKRLRNHPCLALWCGNNEIDVAWSQYNEFMGWGWKQQYTLAQRRKIWDTYDKIFHKLLPTVVGAHHPGMFYWPSSPFNVPGKHAGNDTPNGDVHYWGVWHAEHPFSAYYEHIGRFMSEYGFQSFPELKTVKTYALPEDWNIESPVMMAHQRSGIGNLRIRSYMQQNYQVPTDFEHFLYVGQLLQAEGIKMAVEAHRAAMPYCMGSLYWQINDVWPVASWSGMDYYQRWKALHYFLKKAFEPTITAALVKGGQLRISVISDQLEAREGELRLRLKDFSGQTLWKKDTVIQMPRNSALEALCLELSEICDTVTARKAVLVLDLYSEGRRVYRNPVYLVPAKQLELPSTPSLEKQVLDTEAGIRIRLRAEQLVKNAFLDFGDEVEGFFTDNYFDLLPGETVEVWFKPTKPGLELRAEDLRVLSLGEVMR